MITLGELARHTSTTVKRLHTCESQKHGYRKLTDALRGLAFWSRIETCRDPALMTVYFCHCCARWHLGHATGALGAEGRYGRVALRHIAARPPNQEDQ